MSTEAYTGFHSGPFGSVEVFYAPAGIDEDGNSHPAGYWWHACYPGCLPDGEASGPWSTAQGAYEEATAWDGAE